jgi:glycosyltransferase involved in cell wall biosynthesis
LLRRLTASPVDAVLAQCPVSARAALDVRARLNAKFPVVMVCHFNHSEASEYRGKGELRSSSHFNAMLDFEARVLQEVDRVIYVSKWARQNVEDVRGLRTRSSAVIWNGVADINPQTLTRRDIGLSLDDLVLMNVGSLEPRKNQLGLIDLFAMIHDHFQNAKLVLVGDGPAREEIMQKISDKRLDDHVKLLGHRRDVPALLSLADIYLHYATLENCPLVLLEAARAGLTIAAVPTGGVPELQAALDCQIELHPSDLRGTLERLSPYLADPAARRDAGDRARGEFRRTFTQESMAHAYLTALTFD